MTRQTPQSQHFSCWLSLLVLLSSLSSLVMAAPDDQAGIEFFEKKVRPILVEHCSKCHATEGKKPKGGLALTSQEALLKGGDSGPAIVPGHPEKSRLIEAVCYNNVDLRMPPRAKLPDTAIADLTTWVKMGAPWPRDSSATTVHKEDFDLLKRKREHWAWQPVRAQAAPAVKDSDWCRHDIDCFILARLQGKGMRPAPPADRRTLLRRIYFDLIGLRPAPKDIEDFEQSAIRNPQSAIESVVDRLLASEQFGERWTRHWLDLVRYAESRGHEFDYNIPNAYQYRDYVIRALNADLPYNQFVTEHLAGDLLVNPRLHPTEGFNESILGTGFWFLGEEIHSPVDIRQDQADRFDNRLDVMSKTFLGLTVSCARCHDHKFDAISTRDYYSLLGFLESSNYRLARFDSLGQNRRIAEELWQVREQSRGTLQKALAEGLRPAVDQAGAYLLAAAEGIRQRTDKPGPAAASSFSKEYRERLDAIARARKLDPERLAHWVACLLNADEKSPLLPLAQLAREVAATDAKQAAEVMKHLVADWRKRETDANAALQGAAVVVRYDQPRPGDFLPDEFAFGPRPVLPGSPRFGGDPARPIVRFSIQGAAEKDPTWDGLRSAPGAQNEPGALGNPGRPGHTLRTPTFTITTGKVYALVRGTAEAYAAVGQHVMIAGPLHGRLVQPIKTGESFQWVEFNLTVYKGAPAHLEFTAQDGADFALAMVAQAGRAPGKLDRPNEAVLGLLTGEKAATIDSLSAGYQKALTAALDQIAGNRLLGSPAAPAQAALLNWVLDHPELFPLPREAAERLAETGKTVHERQLKLTALLKRESRLAPAMQDGSGFDEHVFIRGSHKAAGKLTPRRFLEALAGPDPLTVARGSGRLELACQMTNPAINPYLARVFVNRAWHHLFGRGIVASVDNFGVLGERPTHPELIDYLADRFVKDGWSQKKLLRMLILTSTYQMASQGDPAADQADPDNLLLHRANLRRLEGEAIRDAMLAVSGRLNPRMFGPSVPVFLTSFQEGRGRPASGPLDGEGRRSLYLAVRRNFLSSFLLAFDTPIPFSTVGRRTVSNVPAQSLILLNDPFVHQQALVWAQGVLNRPGSVRDRIIGMYQAAFARPPRDGEVNACVAFLERQATLAGKKQDDPAVWADLAHVLFNAKEFIFLN
jgi:cytochrome c553